MKRTVFAFLPLAFLTSVAMPVQADGLLGIIGGSGDNALITIGSGDASNSGLVNLGLGGNNIVDAQVGGQSNIADATVGTSSARGLGADVNVLGGAANVDASVGGRNGLVDANVGLLNNAARVKARVGGSNLVDVDVSVGGGNGGGGNGGGVPGGGNGGGVGGPGNAPILSASNGGDLPATCAGTSPREIQKLMQRTNIGGSWQRASNVAVQRVDMCPEVQGWLAAALSSSGMGPALRSAVSNDALLSASLDRTSYSANRVFAVEQRGNQLTVFVY
jgi:hypothetical protein